MSGNKTLLARNGSPKDEFYTQLSDIEVEVSRYRDQFRGKVVLCNCDDPYESNFFKYFAMNFEHLGLKKLITTSFTRPSAGDQLMLPGLLWSSGEQAHKIEITAIPDANGDGAIDLSDVQHLLDHDPTVISAIEDGDFRSPECLALLDEADIVVTNPPSSLFRQYIALLAEHDKKFLILGDQNSVTSPDIFAQIVSDKLWFGYNSGTKWFAVPDDYDMQTEARKKIVNGVQFFSTGRSLWFTNLDTTIRHEYLTLYKKYTEDEYQTYTNYPAIEVSKVANIPMDYDGEMGVPITFLSKYNPEQFQIVGNSHGLAVTGNSRFHLPNPDGPPRRLYDRIVIRRIGATQ